MFTHYLTIGWRTLRRSPVYSFINVFGLSIGVAACVLIFLYVQDETTYDAFHKNGDRLYRVVRSPKPGASDLELNQSITPYAPLPLGPAIASEIPGVESAVRIMERGEATFTIGDQHFGQEITYADSNFLSVFSFPLLAGDPARALSGPNSLVIHKDLATQWFGTTDVIGRTVEISLWGKVSQREITGVLDDYPRNSTINARALAPLQPANTGWNFWNCFTFVLLKPSAEMSAVDQQMNQIFETHSTGGGNGKNEFLVGLQPLREMHLDPNTGGNDPLYSYILSCIAIAVLLIACINFTTLAMARSSTRAREVSVRKVFGAARSQLIQQFWGESLLVSAAAIVLGLLLAEISLPTFGGLANKTLSLDFASNGWLWASLAGLLVFLTLAAGSVPAVFLSRLQPAAIFRKETGLQKGGAITRSLVVFQYALSITLLICMAGMLAQSSYINALPLGFNKEQVVVITNHAPDSGDKASLLTRLRTELQGDSRILHIAGVSSSVNRGWNQLEWPYRGKNLRSYAMDVDEEYLPTLNIELVAGRNFSRDIQSDRLGSVIVNESFVTAAGMTNPIGEPVDGLSTSATISNPTIIGVMRDYHFLSLHQPMEPLILVADPESACQLFLIRIAASDIPATIERIHSAWDKVSGRSRFEYAFLDDDVDAQYDADQRWMRIVSYSGIIALIVASLGLFGLAGVNAARRMKEIGIRKVLGASVPQVLKTMHTDFLRMIIIANVLAWPAAYYILSQWLATFAFRVGLSPWIFALAAFVAVTAAVVAISLHTFRAARVNPTTLLRNE